MFKDDKDIYSLWDHYWKDQKHNITLLGRMMLRAKQRGLRQILKSINPQHAIEVGCGSGFTLSVFKEMNIDAVGIDVSKTAVEMCRSKGLNAICGKLEDITKTYDFVLCDGMLEHFLNFEPYAKHLMRISKRCVLLMQTDHETFLGKTLIYLSELIRSRHNILEYNYRIRDFVDVFQKNDFKLKMTKSVFGGVFKSLLFEKGLSRPEA